MKSLLRLNWRFLALSLLCLPILSACSAEEPKFAFTDLDFSLADAGSGEKLFGQSNNESPACTACHSLSGGDSSIGNSLAGLADLAGQRVSGESAEEYLYWSIMRPGRYLVAGYSNLMYGNYAESLEPADLADLIAYLLTLH